MKKLAIASLSVLMLTGCGTQASPLAASQAPGTLQAQSAERQRQVFDRLIGMVTVHDETGEVMFEFATKGLIFSDAVRKDPYITVKGKYLEAGYVVPGKDGKLYMAVSRNSDKKGYYVLGTWERPKTLARDAFRQKVDIRLDMKHTFKVKRPLNPMKHITFDLDLKEMPKVATTPFEPLIIK